jgi:hypothetical protein
MTLAAGSVEVPLLKSLVAEQYGVKSINSNQLTIAEGVLKRGSIYEFACVVNEVGPGNTARVPHVIETKRISTPRLLSQLASYDGHPMTRRAISDRP